MILILSQHREFSTDAVMDWIHYEGGASIRLNAIDLYKNSETFELLLDKNKYELTSQKINYKEVESVWFRRWYEVDELFGQLNKDNYSETNQQLTDAIKSEIRVISNFFFYLLKDKTWLTKPEQISINKILSLTIAHEVGLDIPTSCITSNLSKLDKKQNYITKPLSDGVLFKVEGIHWSNYTTEIESEHFTSDNNYPISLYQENLDKEFEIRAFYLYGEFFSMAIFSQNNTQTKTDFRVYDDLEPNRTVPYQLDREIEIKLKNFMNAVKLDTGSIDLVQTKDGRLVFLEVNPVGQFGMVSYPCNYFIEKKIAKILLKKQ